MLGEASVPQSQQPQTFQFDTWQCCPLQECVVSSAKSLNTWCRSLRDARTFSKSLRPAAFASPALRIAQFKPQINIPQQLLGLHTTAVLSNLLRHGSMSCCLFARWIHANQQCDLMLTWMTHTNWKGSNLAASIHKSVWNGYKVQQSATTPKWGLIVQILTESRVVHRGCPARSGSCRYQKHVYELNVSIFGDDLELLNHSPNTFWEGS